MVRPPVNNGGQCAGSASIPHGSTSARGAVHVAPSKPWLLDRVRDAIRTRHYSRRTEEAYVSWIRRYILFHGRRHPDEMGAAEITRFLTSLAVQGKVVASTQNQVLSALLFLYREVLGQEGPWLDGLVHAKASPWGSHATCLDKPRRYDVWSY